MNLLIGPRAEHHARLLRKLLWLSCAVVALCALCSDAALAATMTVGGKSASFTLFDSLETDAHNQSNTWFTRILALVRPTFIILATIEICWAAAIWAMEKDNLSSLAVDIIKKIMFIGFFFALLQYAPEWVPTIANSFQFAGEQATGMPPLTTDGIIAQGLALIQVLWSGAPTGFFDVLGKLGQIIVACFVTLGIVVAYVILAAQYFTLKIESYLLFAAGAIFLGLGASSWTNEYVSKYLNYAINVGVRLLVMILILSLMLSAAEQMAIGYNFDYEPLLKLLAVSILQTILGIKAPEMAGSLLGGGIGLSAGSASSAAGSALGGIGKVAGMASSAAGAVSSAAGRAGAAGQGGLNKAVSAGRQLGESGGKSGASATLGGLGKAVGDAAKQIPGRMMNALKGGGQGGQGQGGGNLRGQLNPSTSGSGAAGGTSSGIPGAAAAGASNGGAASGGSANNSSSAAPGLSASGTPAAAGADSQSSAATSSGTGGAAQPAPTPVPDAAAADSGTSSPPGDAAAARAPMQTATGKQPTAAGGSGAKPTQAATTQALRKATAPNPNHTGKLRKPRPKQ